MADTTILSESPRVNPTILSANVGKILQKLSHSLPLIIASITLILSSCNKEEIRPKTRNMVNKNAKEMNISIDTTWAGCINIQY